MSVQCRNRDSRTRSRVTGLRRSPDIVLLRSPSAQCRSQDSRTRSRDTVPEHSPNARIRSQSGRTRSLATVRRRNRNGLLPIRNPVTAPPHSRSGQIRNRSVRSQGIVPNRSPSARLRRRTFALRRSRITGLRRSLSPSGQPRSRITVRLRSPAPSLRRNVRLRRPPGLLRKRVPRLLPSAMLLLLATRRSRQGTSNIRSSKRTEASLLARPHHFAFRYAYRFAGLRNAVNSGTPRRMRPVPISEFRRFSAYEYTNKTAAASTNSTGMSG